MKKLEKNKSKKKNNKIDIHQIISEYNEKHKKIFRNTRNSANNIILNKTFNSKRHTSFGKRLSNRQKIEEELSKFSKESRLFFNNSLNKYIFDMEVYIPQNLTKKEYANKNYLINQLINIERMNKNTKKIIEPIQKETKKFSRHYKLIKSENKDHQESYMNNLEQLYQSKGYKINNIEYKHNENIFTPSFLLDRQFGEDQHKDANKYSNINNEFYKDRQILEKLETICSKNTIHVTDDNNNYLINGIKDKEKDEEIKRELLEEKKIMKMSRREYRIYNKKLKKEISLIKQKLKELYPDNNNSQNESYLNTNRTNYTRDLKLFLDPNEKEKEINQINDQKKTTKKKDDSNNIFLSARNLDLETDFNKYLPSINSLFVDTRDNSEYRKKTVHSIKSKSTKNKINRMNRNHRFMTYKTENNEFSRKEIESYFKKYSNRILPRIKDNLGNNVLGHIGNFQNKVKDKSFGYIIKGNEYMKYIIDNNYIANINNTMKNKIENVDDTINNLHFTMMEKLLGN